MLLKVIPVKETPENIQISQFSSKCDQLRNSIGKYALIPTNKFTFCLCKVFTSQEVHPAYIDLNRSVIHVRHTLPNGFPSVTSNVSVDTVDLSAVEMLPPPSILQAAQVTVVFESVFDIPMWKNSLNVLSSLVKDLLKLFVFMKSSIIFLENLPTVMRHGIHCIIIHSITCDNIESAGFVSSKTCITINKVVSKKYFEQMIEFTKQPKKNFPKEPFELLKSIVHLKSKWTNTSNHQFLPPQKVILTGPSGCGKTSLVVAIAAEANATLVSYSNYSKTSGNHVENLKLCYSEAKALAAEMSDGICMLLLENIDLFCKRRDSNNMSADNLCTILQLLSLIEEAKTEQRLLIVATTSQIQNVDPALRTSSTFNFEIVMEQSEEDREDILISLLQPLNPTDYSSVAKEIARLTPGYVAADLALICHKVACLNDPRTLEDPGKLLCELKKVVADSRPSSSAGALGVLKKRVRSTQPLGGLFEVKKKIRATLEDPLNNPEAYFRLGLPPPKGLLLYGPPGCAKTSLVNAIASSIPVTFLSVSSADLYSPYVGEAEQNIVNLFRRARCSAPSILFIDEIDALVGRREGREAGVHDRVLSAFLMEMDGVSASATVRAKELTAENETDPTQQEQVRFEKLRSQTTNTTVVVIGATNRPDILDAALLRPGRFDKLVHVPAPDVSERVDILRGLTSSMPLSADVDLNSLARQTDFFSGADLAHLCTSAGLNALAMDGMSVAEIGQRHFDACIKTTKPSLTAEQIVWYEKFAQGS